MIEAEERVILVDREDVPIGTAGKLEAHEQGALHRAFSVFLLNSRGEILLQRRAAVKYHGGGLWSNSCCGHPRPGEPTGEAARRRLREEMGLDCTLEPVFAFTYRADMAGGLTEHEIDHVFVGIAEGEPHPDPSEVEDWRWTSPAAIREELRENRSAYTPWFEAALTGFFARRLAGGAANE
jgi:isopentenyl-diphosphate Delta-isomerase